MENRNIEQTSNALSLAGMIMGILSLLFLLLFVLVGTPIIVNSMIDIIAVEESLNKIRFYSSLILWFLLLLSILSFFFSFTSMSRGMAGRGMAVAGLVTSIIAFVFTGVLLILPLLYS